MLRRKSKNQRSLMYNKKKMKCFDINLLQLNQPIPFNGDVSF